MKKIHTTALGYIFLHYNKQVKIRRDGLVVQTLLCSLQQLLISQPVVIYKTLKASESICIYSVVVYQLMGLN